MQIDRKEELKIPQGTFVDGVDFLISGLFVGTKGSFGISFEISLFTTSSKVNGNLFCSGSTVYILEQ